MAQKQAMDAIRLFSGRCLGHLQSEILTHVSFKAFRLDLHFEWWSRKNHSRSL
jgi:hypothetical protein